MAPTHSGATAPVRAQGPARYSVREHGLGVMCQAQARGVVWDGGSLARVGDPHARPERDAITRSGPVGRVGSSCCTLEVRRGRAGGDLFDPGRLDLNTSPAREKVSENRWVPGFLPPNRGAWS